MRNRTKASRPTAAAEDATKDEPAPRAWTPYVLAEILRDDPRLAAELADVATELATFRAFSTSGVDLAPLSPDQAGTHGRSRFTRSPSRSSTTRGPRTSSSSPASRI
jgi:hypothetical protein